MNKRGRVQIGHLCVAPNFDSSRLSTSPLRKGPTRSALAATGISTHQASSAFPLCPVHKKPFNIAHFWVHNFEEHSCGPGADTLAKEEGTPKTRYMVLINWEVLLIKEDARRGHVWIGSFGFRFKVFPKGKPSNRQTPPGA